METRRIAVLKPALIGLFAVAAAVSTAAQGASDRRPQMPLTILFHGDPKPEGSAPESSTIKVGNNKFEVLVKDAEGKTVDNGEVSLALAAVTTQPSAKPTTIELKHFGDGIYRGEGRATAPGSITATIVVKDHGSEIGRRVMNLVVEPQ